MEFHEIDSIGKLWIERVATLPTWTSADIGRLVYAIDDDKFYKANAVEWAEFGNPVTIYNGSTITPTLASYVNGSQIQLRPGRYHHYGSSKEQIVYWNSTLTFTFSSFSTYMYLYLDDSAIAALGSPEIGVSQLIASGTPPTYNATTGGYYNGWDRCIGIFRCSGGALVKFYQIQKEQVMFESEILLYGSANPSSWTTVTASVPLVSLAAMFTVHVNPSNSGGYYAYMRPYGSTSSGHLVGVGKNHPSGDNDAYHTVNMFLFPTDSAGRVQVYVTSAGGGVLMRVLQNGFCLPPGIV